MINKTNIKNLLFLSSSETISGVLFFLAMIYIARILGPEAYGKINVARSLILYFLMFVSAGLDFYGIREGSRIPSELKNLIERIVGLRFILSVITIALLLLLIQFFPKDILTRKLLLYYGGMIILTSISLEWYFQSTERMGLSSSGRLIGELIFISIILFVVNSPEKIIWIPVARVLGTLLQQLFYWIITVKELGSIYLRGNLPLWISMLKISLPMGFGFIMVQIYYYLDSIMLGVLAGYEQVGIYAASYKLLTAIILVTSMLNKAIYPQLSKLYKSSVAQMSHLLQDSMQYMLIVTIWLIFHGFIFASQGIILLYKEGFLESIPVFRILIFNLLPVGINGLLAYGLLASDNQKQYLISVTMGAAFNFILNLVLIPRFGLYGAAGATLFSELSLLIYYFLFYYRSELYVRWNRMGCIFITGLGLILFFSYMSKFLNIMYTILVFNVLYFYIFIALKWLPVDQILRFVKNRRSDS